MEIVDITGYLDTRMIVPRTRADAIACVHCRGIGRRSRAEVGMPREITRPSSPCQHLTVLVGSGETSDVSSVARAGAREEKGHRRFGCAIRGVVTSRRARSE